MTYKAFTLAEVLITLGIIGIVAAMTLPSLTGKTKYKEFETRYKVASNLLHNAVNYFHSQELMMTESTYCTANSNADYCQSGQYRVFSEVLAEAFSGIHALNKGGHGSYAANKYYNFTGGAKFNVGLLNDGYMELKNGMSVIVETGGSSSNPIIFFDVNGTSVKPNRIGHDTFAFIIDKGDRICPLGSPSCKKRTEYIENTDNFLQSKFCNPSASTDQNNGLTCGYFASIDKDYFKKIK